MICLEEKLVHESFRDFKFYGSKPVCPLKWLYLANVCISALQILWCSHVKLLSYVCHRNKYSWIFLSSLVFEGGILLFPAWRKQPLFFSSCKSFWPTKGVKLTWCNAQCLVASSSSGSWFLLHFFFPSPLWDFLLYTYLCSLFLFIEIVFMFCF